MNTSQTLQEVAMLRSHQFTRIQCNVAILTHHRNFPANLTNHCHLPQLPPFRGYTKGGNSPLQSSENGYTRRGNRQQAMASKNSEIVLASIFYHYPRVVRSPFYIESGNTSMKCNENYMFCCE